MQTTRTLAANSRIKGGFTTRALALLGLLTAGCGTGTGSGDGGSPSDASETGSSAGAIGVFRVQLVAPRDDAPGYTQVVGKVQTGPTPAQVVWTTTMSDGDCVLQTPSVPFCSTPCGSAGACVANDTCAPFATSLAAGTVRVTGLRASDGSTSPVELRSVSNAYQLPATPTLAYPAFSEGDAIRLEAAGAGAVAAFTLDGRGIAPLALSEGALTLSEGNPFELRWTGSSQSSQRVSVKLDVSHHGGSRGQILCDTADDGELTLSANMVTRLLQLGVAGYPTVIVTRSYVGRSADTGGTYELVISSEVEKSVTTPSVRSCTTNEECEAGTTCRADLTCG